MGSIPPSSRSSDTEISTSASASARSAISGSRLRRRFGRDRGGRLGGRLGRGGAGNEDAGLFLEGLGSGGVALQAVDLREGEALLRGLRGKALLLEDVPQLGPRVDVVGEAGDDRLELVRGLVDEAVLAEDPALGEVLVDELLVLLAQGAR